MIAINRAGDLAQACVSTYLDARMAVNMIDIDTLPSITITKKTEGKTRSQQRLQAAATVRFIGTDNAWSEKYPINTTRYFDRSRAFIREGLKRDQTVYCHVRVKLFFPLLSTYQYRTLTKGGVSRGNDVAERLANALAFYGVATESKNAVITEIAFMIVIDKKRGTK